MRAFLNDILDFIGTTSLTDPEFDSVVAVFTIYEQETYDDLARILKDRESVSTYQDRLIAYYAARGADIDALNVAGSNIYIGSTL